MSKSYGYGWKPSLPDARNWQHRFAGAPIAPSVDLRDTGHLPEVWDQGELGSCTAHGAGAAYSFDLAVQGSGTNFIPSRLFVYYNTRVIEDTVSYDSGATIADAIKSINRYGCPPESDWPYIIAKFTRKPPQEAFVNGELRQALKYAVVRQTANDMKACLTAGTPIVVGFTVYESFESDEVAETGDVPLPGPTEQVLGGHCVLVVGYTKRNGKDVWICRNSWGTEWGDNGYFYFPEAYLLNSELADDFWTVQQVESPDPAPQPPTPVPPTPEPAPEPEPTPEPTPAPDDALMTFLTALYQWLKDWFTK
jgi:C1A family cysteine protease